MKRHVLLSASVALGLALLGSQAPADVPEHASSRMRNIEDRLEVLVPSGSPASIFDTLTARVKRAGYAITSRDDKKYRLVVDRPAALSESNLLSDNNNGSEWIRMRFEVTEPKKNESGYRVTGAIVFLADKGGLGEKDVELDQRQPYRDEIKAYLRGLVTDPPR